MISNLKILFLEDNQTDVDLINRELKKAGINFTSKIVETRTEFEHALQNFNPDLILSDYSLPSFDAVAAFHIKQNQLPHIPFIIVSGFIGEENAVDLIKEGVTDYASKDKLFTLSSKINRALKDLKEWKEKQIIAEKLKEQTEALIIANQELTFQNEEKEKRANELIIANKELTFQNQEKEKRANELIIANKELAFQNEEKKNRADELDIANKELIFQNEEKKNRADELDIANKELIFQNDEKKNRADELDIANKELTFQNEEKKNRADELVIANKELTFQNEEKKNRADELDVANKELTFQNEEKKNRADELVIANKELTFQNEEKKNRANELTLANKELTDYKHSLDQSSIIAITDKKGIINHVNDNFCKISKYAAEELIGQDHRIMNSNYHSKEFIKNLWTTISNGEVWRGELKNKAKDGTIYWVDTTIVPFLDDKKKPFQYLAIRSDITEKKQVEEQLHLFDVQKTAILNTLPANIALIDKEGIIVSVNKAWIDYGIVNGSKSNNCNIGDNYLTVSEGATGEEEQSGKEIAKGIRAVLCEEIEKFTLEYPCHSPEEQRWYQVFVTPSKNNVITGAVIMHLNITEKKQFEIEKEKMMEDIILRNKNLEQFSYIISHNLRAPVANILGLTSLLQEENNTVDSVGYINTSINTSAQKLDEVIKDLNDILQIKNNISEVKELVNFKDLVTDIQLSIDISIKKENATITWDFAEVPEITTIKSYLYSIFYNLISNSLKYRQRDIPLLLSIKSQLVDNKIILLFKDNGIGIDLSKQNNMIFGLYKRFHTNYAEGKGVGLFMVKTQVETIGGSISVKSDVNKGTEFRIEFPI